MVRKLTTLSDQPVYDWSPGDPLRPGQVPRVSWAHHRKKIMWPEIIASLAGTPGFAELRGLVIGVFGQYGVKAPVVLNELLPLAGSLRELRAIFIGDMDSDEWEISWIESGDMAPVLVAFPQLQYLGLRGGEGLSFSSVSHANLRTLVIETGGLSGEVVRSVLAGDLPALEHLELWLGTDQYGGTTTVADLQPLLSGQVLPRLRYLGLRNSEIADEIAVALQNAPILERIQILDLSQGNLSDCGGQALAASPHVKALKKLDLHHHFLSEEMEATLVGLVPGVNVSGRLEPDEDDDEIIRYIAVAE